MSGLDRDSLEASLRLLGEVLERAGERQLHLVVSGGSALLAAEIVRRNTNDVDVIAMRGEVDGDIVPGYPLPAFLKGAVTQVAEELRLAPDWLNASTAMMMIDLARFPRELWSDLIERDYGPSLRVTFVGRAGQIYLKMYAAVNRKEERDLDDLRLLEMTAEEAESVASWLLDEEVIDRENAAEVFAVLKEIGRDEVAERIRERSR